jgi:hypothetical protein
MSSSLITGEAAAYASGLSKEELPSLLKRWMVIQDEMSMLNAELKQRRTTAKALKDMILRIMESNNVVQLNVSKGAVIHKTREVKTSINTEYLEKHCKEFFNGDETRAAQLIAYLNEHRTTVQKHDLRLVPGSDSSSQGSK